MTDAFGNLIFESIKITLVCGAHTTLLTLTCNALAHRLTRLCADECLKTDAPEKCAAPIGSCVGHTPHHFLCSTDRCRHKLASMPRWLSSKKVETVRALLAGASQAPPPLPKHSSPCPFAVRRGSGYAVRATPSHALGHSSRGTLATSSGSSLVSFSLLAVGEQRDAYGHRLWFQWWIQDRQILLSHTFRAREP